MCVWANMSKGSKVRANLDRSRRPLTTTTHSVLIHTFLFEHQMVSPILLKIQQLHLTAAVTDKHSELCHQSVQTVPSTVSPSGLLLRFKKMEAEYFHVLVGILKVYKMGEVQEWGYSGNMIAVQCKQGIMTICGRLANESWFHMIMATQ